MIRFETELGGSEYWYEASEVAKYVNITNPHTGRKIGRNHFLQLLRFNRYVVKDSNQPTQAMINMNLIKFHMVKRRYKRFGMPIFHERSLEYFKQRVMDGRIQIGFEKIRKSSCVKQLDDVC